MKKQRAFERIVAGIFLILGMITVVSVLLITIYSLSAVKDNVKALSVGGVAPSEETVKDGSMQSSVPSF